MNLKIDNQNDYTVLLSLVPRRSSTEKMMDMLGYDEEKKEVHRMIILPQKSERIAVNENSFLVIEKL